MKTYSRVAVRIIKWAEHLDHHAEEHNSETADLLRVFKERFRFHCEVTTLGLSGCPQTQLNAAISDHVRDHDGADHLLIVYYTGHGFWHIEKECLEISAERCVPSERHCETTAIWNEAEIPLMKNTQGDVWSILDCCFGSNIMKSGGQDRVYSLLAASPMNTNTYGPGRNSLTRALVKALDDLVQSQPSFTLLQLQQTINRARTITTSQLWSRLETYHRQICLAPLQPNEIRQPAMGTNHFVEAQVTSRETGEGRSSNNRSIGLRVIPLRNTTVEVQAHDNRSRETGPSSSGPAIIDIDMPQIDSRSVTLSSAMSRNNEGGSNNTGDVTEIITTQLEDFPRGYPQLAAFQSSEPSWSIYRSFDYLHSRVMLELQDELRTLEGRLSDLDNLDYVDGASARLRSRTNDPEQGRDHLRGKLLESIRGKLVQYDEILIKARELNAFQRPSKHDYRSFRTWFSNTKPLINAKEEQFIKRKEDLVSLRHGRERTGFEGQVERAFRTIRSSLMQRLFMTPENRAKSSRNVIYYSNSRIEKLVTVIFSIIIFAMLVMPVITMYKLTEMGWSRKSSFEAIGVVFMFAFGFAAALSILTKAKRHEIFAATAAYLIVLTIFIGNINPSTVGTSNSS